MECFAVCSTGLEPWTAQEFAALGFDAQVENRIESSHKSQYQHDSHGAAFECRLQDLPRVNSGIRTATRVLVTLARFNAAKFVELRRKASHIDWENYLDRGQPIKVKVTAHHSRLYHSQAIANEIKKAIDAQIGNNPSMSENTGQRVIVRLIDNDCTISIDSSGEPLYQRGYRLASAKAPLRESLAAGILMASGWDRQSPLVDPFCGSGTIPIEAALMATGCNPRAKRGFAFQSWKIYCDMIPSSSENLCADPTPQRLPQIIGADRDTGAITMAKANACRAGMDSAVKFLNQSLSDAAPPPGVGWVVTNPPYGHRISRGQDLRNLYAQIGHVLRRDFNSWRFAILCNDQALISHTRLFVENTYAFSNGGLPVQLFIGKVT